MINHTFNDYGYDKAENFNALMPKVMEKVGEDMLVGGSDVVVPSFDEAPRGAEPLVVVSSEQISNEVTSTEETTEEEEEVEEPIEEEEKEEEKVGE